MQRSYKMDLKVNRSPKIKICGLTSKEDIEMVNGLAIDYVGFVFASSKREVTPRKAKELMKLLNPKIKTVGVFVNEDMSKVNEVAHLCSLDIVQLHGSETPKTCQKSTKPVWKAFSVATIKDVERHLCYPDVAGILLDTFVPGVPGGSGRTFNWDVATGIQRSNIILAGGLSPSNVGSAIDQIRPDVVDVSSGVEKDGVKDLGKIIEFIRSVKGYE